MFYPYFELNFDEVTSTKF